MTLPPERAASWGKLATWGQVAGTGGLPEGDLGTHQTWRKGYVRGGQLAAQVEAALERARRAVVRATGDEATGAVVDAIAADPFAEDADGEQNETGNDAGPWTKGGGPDD